MSSAVAVTHDSNSSTVIEKYISNLIFYITTSLYLIFFFLSGFVFANLFLTNASFEIQYFAFFRFTSETKLSRMLPKFSLLTDHFLAVIMW